MCIEWGNHVIGGRERAKQIDNWKHFADSEWAHEADLRRYCQPAGGHLDQAAARSAMAVVRRWDLGQEYGYYFLRDLSPQEGCYRQGHQVESRRPFREVSQNRSQLGKGPIRHQLESRC